MILTLREALGLAEALRAEMAPYCEQVEIAGSVRRRKAEVKDLEIVAIPRWRTMPNPESLFEEDRQLVNDLYGWATRGPAIQWHKPGGDGAAIEHHELHEEGKYWRGVLKESGAKLDLFLARPENFGAIFLIRTGSAEFSRALVTHARTIGFRFQDGYLWNPAGEMVRTRDERDVFEALNLRWVQPDGRYGEDVFQRCCIKSQPRRSAGVAS